jgi:2-polyprenyl-6-methoxyphenol hydroxylase-like FAD-dependent oxidoreductase
MRLIPEVSKMRNPIFKQAVVVGAGMAGLAAAKAIAPHFEKVTVFDRDSLPDAPMARSGTPQCRHTHALLAGGHSALDRMFPGIEIDLMDAGAVRMRLRRDLRLELPGFDPFPQRDFGYDQFALSRPALERVCRRRVEQEPYIEIRSRARVTEVIASSDNSRVAGVRFEDVRGTSGTLAADLVVDASGRISLTQGFLEAVGSPKPLTVEIGMDQAYSTLAFEKPKDAPTDWLAVIHAPAPPQSSRHGVIFPMEGGRWSVSLAEDHKAPPGDIDGFKEFVASFRTSTIFRAIRAARPIGDVARFRMPCSVRCAYDRLDRFPRGLIPLGDSACRFPPIFGQGMSVAVQECCVLAGLIESRRWRADPLDGLAEAFLKEIQPLLETPWSHAMAELVHPETRGERPPDFEQKLKYGRALVQLSAEDPEVDRIVSEVRALLRPFSALREPKLAARVNALLAETV